MAGRLKKYIQRGLGQTTNTFVIAFIPPNCSLLPKEMTHRKQNGVNTFKEIMQHSKEDKQLLLNPANWCIIIEFIYEQISLENHLDKLKTLQELLTTATNSLKQNQEYRIAHLVQQNHGMVEFLQALGFQKGIIKNRLVMLEPNTDIITAAIYALKTKMLLMTAYEELCTLWQACMNKILQHPIYNKQCNLTQLIHIDFVLNYGEYYDLVQKLIKISQMKTRSNDEFILQIMRQIGFTENIKRQKNDTMIFEYVRQIYDQFRNIENIKHNIRFNDHYINMKQYMADADDIKTECVSDGFCLSKEQMQWRQTNGVKFFIDILNMKSESDQYTHLMNPVNWSILIDAIYVNMSVKDDPIHQLNWLREVVEKAVHITRRRKIKLNCATADQMILSVHGSLEFLRGVGFAIDEDRLVLEPSPFITEIAINAVAYKIRILEKLAHLNILWKQTIKALRQRAHALINQNTLTMLSTKNVYRCHDDYCDILSKIIDVNRAVFDENKQKIAIELLHELGLDLDISKRDELNLNLVKCLNGIYNQMKIIENDKKARNEEIANMQSTTQRLTVVGMSRQTITTAPSLHGITSQNIMGGILQFGRNYDDQKYDESTQELMSEKELDALYDCDDMDELKDETKQKVDEMQAMTLQMEEYLGYIQHLRATKSSIGRSINQCQDVHCKWDKKKVELFELNQRQIVHVMFYHTEDHQQIAASSRRANRFNQTLRGTRQRKRKRRSISLDKDDEKSTPNGWDSAQLEPGGKCLEMDCKLLAHVLSRLVNVDNVHLNDDDDVLSMDDVDHCLEFHGDYRTDCIDGKQCPLHKNANNKVVQLHAHFYHDVAIDGSDDESDTECKDEDTNKERIQYKSFAETDVPVPVNDVVEFGSPFIILSKAEARFGNPKEEMLRNSYRQMQKREWNDLLKRCVPFAKAKNARRSRLNLKQIVSLKVYTDFDKLQREFRMCFRDTDPKRRKKRQKEFFFWNSLIELSCKKSCDAIGEKLYHGINDSQLSTSCFSGTYYGPVSTTTDVAVAKGFAGDNGQILELYPSFGAKGLSVSWLSNFPDENEVLYMNVSFQISNIIKNQYKQRERGSSNMKVMEESILNALRTINIDSQIISLNDNDDSTSSDSSNFKTLERYEKLCVLYLLYIQYRPTEWNELVRDRTYLSAAFMAFRDQFISLAQNVRAVWMDNMCPLLQIFFYTASHDYQLPILDVSNDVQFKSMAMSLESKYVANQPFYFSHIVRLFPSAQQIALNGSNFDWSLKRLIDFLAVYDFNFHKIKLKHIYLRRIDQNVAKQRFIDCGARDNLYKLRKFGWQFITPIHLRRVGLKPAPELPFLLTFIDEKEENNQGEKGKQKIFRTHSEMIMLPSDFAAANTPGDDPLYEEAEEGIADADKYVFVDHNPQNCTLSLQIYDGLHYKEELCRMLWWRKQHWKTKIDIAQPGMQTRYRFVSECAKVECLVLDPVPKQLLKVFYDKYGDNKYVISFESVTQIFSNLTDLFLRNTTFKLRECLKFCAFIKENHNHHLKRIHFSQTNRIRQQDIKKVKLRLKECKWNFIKSQQMICSSQL
eukprot:511104_1